MALRWKYLTAAMALLALEGIIALYVHDGLIRPYLGDVLAVLAVYCLVRTAWPRGIRLLPLFVFLFAAAVEISQFFHLAAALGADRVPLLGVLLGGTFDWADLLCYGIGCLLLWAWQEKAWLSGRGC
jgi:hypothetical protein